MKGKIYIKKISPKKRISGITFVFGNLATGLYSAKFFSRCTSSGPTGSNDTGLMSVWPPGTESIAGHTHKHTG